MARKEEMSDNIGGMSGNTVYTLNETSVGKNGNNRKRSDVQLIQFFLRQYYKNAPETFRLLPKTKSNSGLLTIDGVNGPQTEKGIYWFQMNMRLNKANLSNDSLVNVAATTVSTKGTIYTIFQLNSYFKQYGDGKELHANLEDHPDIVAYAPELQAELRRAQVGNKF